MVSEVALNTEIALLIQIVFFETIFGAISARRSLRPKGQNCCARAVYRAGHCLWSGRHMAGQRDLIAGLCGARSRSAPAYGALRVLGTALVFRGVRRLIAGKLVASDATA
jgi:hypothetical protein